MDTIGILKPIGIIRVEENCLGKSIFRKCELQARWKSGQRDLFLHRAKENWIKISFIYPGGYAWGELPLMSSDVRPPIASAKHCNHPNFIITSSNFHQSITASMRPILDSSQNWHRSSFSVEGNLESFW